MRLRVLLFTLILLTITACSSSDAPTFSTNTPAPLTGFVEFAPHLQNAVFYSEVLNLSGTAQDMVNDRFRIRVINALDEVIAETVVTVQDEQWEVSLVHGYTGEPMQLNIFALPENTQFVGDYALLTTIISDLEYRPDGLYGAILYPLADDVVGGDQIEVYGTLSGTSQPAWVQLVIDDEVISEFETTYQNTTRVDEMWWETELILPTDYAGPATLKLGYKDDTGSFVEVEAVNIMLSIIAG